MNEIRLLFCLGIIGLSNLLLSCHTDYIKYEENKDRVYFSQYQYVKGDASYNRFPYWDQGNRLTVSRYLNVMGFPADKDREVQVEIVDSLTTAIEGEDFVLSEKFVIPAGKVSSQLPMITWNRREEGDTRSDTLSVGLMIVENENFIPTMGYIIKLCYIHGEISKPGFWYDGIFGPFSPGLLYKFLDQYNSLKETNPEVYEILYGYVGEDWNIYYWPDAVDYLISKFIMTPLYYYYQEHPEPGVVIPPRYQ